MTITREIPVNVRCMVCGGRWDTIAECMDHACPVDEELFEAIEELEYQVRINRPLHDAVTSQHQLKLRAGEDAALRRFQQELFAAVDAMTPAQQLAYGEWRKGRN